MAERYDVVVVGAGPAGLSAAKTVAAEGGKPLLLEFQAQIGGQTQSASWVSNDLAKEFRDTVVADVREVRLHSPHRELRVGGGFGAIVDRRIFDKLLAAEAVAAGAEVWVGCPVRELLLSEGRVQGIRAEAGAWAERVECEVVIDASGARGEWSGLFLRKVLGRDWDREHLALSSEYLMANASADEGADLYFTSYFAPSGYAWVYPFGKRFALAGICGARIHPDAALDEFIGRRGIPRLEKAAPIASYRNQFPLGGALDQTCADGIIAAGGAAGQVYPLSGQGLRYALRCGELAGRVAVNAIAAGSTSREALAEYESLWRREFESELLIGRWLRSALAIAQDQKMDSLLNALAADQKLSSAFINVFLGEGLPEAARELLANEGVGKIFGREIVEKVITGRS